MANELDELDPSGNGSSQSGSPEQESRKRSFFGGLSSRLPASSPNPKNAQVEVKPDAEREANARKNFF